MENNLQQLTEKIYQEGIVKADQRAAEIIEEAKIKAREIVEQGEKRAIEIIANAEANSASIKNKTEAELRLAARQALGNLKQRITDLIITDLMHLPVKKAFGDVEFVQSLISKLVEHWVEHFGQDEHLQIVLPESEMKAYQSYISESLQRYLTNGAEIKFDTQITNGFQIRHEDKGFKISFTDRDFENYLKSFAKPTAYNLLFGED